MNEILMCGTDPVGQLYKDTKAEATSIAPIEVSPAESSHSVGTHIMVDGVRYRVTSAISIGDTLTIGTNISAENIEDNLNADDITYGSGNVKTALDNTFKSFDDWTLLSDFDTNNDTWIATDDGFLSVRATNVGATNGTYCYLYDIRLSSSVPISTISLPSGGGSLTYAQVIPVIKGHTYKMLMGGAISSVASYFLKINK